MRLCPRLLALALLLTFSCKHADPMSPFKVQSAPTGVAVFTQSPKVKTAKVSPKGTYVATLSEEGGKRALAIVNVATRQANVLIPEGESTIGTFMWATDERLVFESVVDLGYFAAPVSHGEIYAMDANGGRSSLIFSYRSSGETGSHIKKREAEYAWAHLIGSVRNDSRNVLIEQYSMGDVADRVADIYKLDVYSGLKTKVTRSPIPHAQFVTDENGELRVAAGYDENLNRRYFYFEGLSGWRELSSVRGLSKDSAPVGFLAKERAMYVSEPEGDGYALYLVSIETGERRQVTKRDGPPASATVEDPATGRIVAVEYQPDLPTYDFLEQNHPLSRILQGLLDSNPGEHVRIVNTTSDGRKALVRVYSDRDPGRFLLADVASMSAETIAEARPWLKADSMSEMSAFHIPASDGFRIHGYVTLPPNAPPGAAPPLIVLPHGGPHGVRDHWGFDWEVQLLAHEGFAVLQVNYRGSGGYGLAYQEAGYRKWGDRVVQDIIDATRFAVRKGFGDPKRICIYGASFGAYAALQGSILAPDLFRCAAGYAGIYDLDLLTSTGDIRLGRLGRGYVRTAVGEDKDLLAKASPARHADQISAQVFLIHGKRDERAPIEHAEALRDALTAKGKPPLWLVESKEGHGFYDEGARLRMYERLLTFFKENTRPEAAAITR
jgi:dipeptidyl aminopeptidase/acylaminoacyl peptidase